MNQIEKAIRDLSSPDKNTRFEACFELQLAYSLPEQAIAALEAATHDPEPLVAEAARRALASHSPTVEPLSSNHDLLIKQTQIENKESSISLAAPVSKPNPDLQTAGDWYFWLWLSPILTISTLLLLNSFAYGEYSEELVLIVLGSAVWHLILLYPAIKGRTAFIRWHGRQALLLAAIRTIVALGTAISLFAGGSSPVFGVLLLIGLWLAGNLWGQRQARRGDCALMRWTGHGADLPIPIGQASPSTQLVVQPQPDSALVNHLVNIIRFNPDPAVRRAALDELEQLGLVESL